jgi:hypothetical protein
MNPGVGEEVGQTSRTAVEALKIENRKSMADPLFRCVPPSGQH